VGDESAKRAAEEFLAARLSEEGQSYESRANLEAAIALAPTVWKKVAETVITQCHEWNEVTGEQTLTYRETTLGDLRILCAGRSHQMSVHYDSRKRLITIKNSARPKGETDTILSIEGYWTGSGREAQLVRSKEAVNLDMVILGHLRVLAGLSRRADG